MCLYISICILAHALFIHSKMIIQFSLLNGFTLQCYLHYCPWNMMTVWCWTMLCKPISINLFGNFVCSSFGTFLWLYLYRFHTIKINRKIPRGEWKKIQQKNIFKKITERKCIDPSCIEELWEYRECVTVALKNLCYLQSCWIFDEQQGKIQLRFQIKEWK